MSTDSVSLGFAPDALNIAARVPMFNTSGYHLTDALVKQQVQKSMMQYIKWRGYHRNPDVFERTNIMPDVFSMAKRGKAPACPFPILSDWSEYCLDRDCDPPDIAWPVTHPEPQIATQAIMCRALLRRLNEHRENGTLDSLWNPPQEKGPGAKQVSRTEGVARMTEEVSRIIS